MPRACSTPTALPTAHDVKLARDVVALLAPRWSIWITATIGAEAAGQSIDSLRVALPWISRSSMRTRLADLGEAGLTAALPVDDSPVSNTERRYRLTTLGQAILPLHDTLARWSRDHLDCGAVPNAEAAELAIQALKNGRSLDVCTAVLRLGTATLTDLDNQLSASGRSRMRGWTLIACDRGLIRPLLDGRSYEPTNAGRALAPVLSDLAAWADWYLTPGAASRRTPPRIAPLEFSHREAPGSMEAM